MAKRNSLETELDHVQIKVNELGKDSQFIKVNKGDTLADVGKLLANSFTSVKGKTQSGQWVAVKEADVVERFTELTIVPMVKGGDGQ